MKNYGCTLTGQEIVGRNGAIPFKFLLWGCVRWLETVVGFFKLLFPFLEDLIRDSNSHKHSHLLSPKQSKFVQAIQIKRE